jgi:hypothetical protein
MDTKLTITDKKLQTNSCNILLQCFTKYNDIPPMSCQEATHIHNHTIQHQCILGFKHDTKNIESIWEKIKVHIPYIKKADLQIKDKYNGPIHEYIQYSKNKEKDPLSELPPYFLT